MDFSGFGSLMGRMPTGGIPNGGILGGIGRMMPGPAAPQVPADGAMQPTIGPGMPVAAPAAPQAKFGMPNGGLLGLLQGQSPQGLMGLLKAHMGGPSPGAQPGIMGMLGGMPGAAPAAPVQLPQNINPADQF